MIRLSLSEAELAKEEERSKKWFVKLRNSQSAEYQFVSCLSWPSAARFLVAVDCRFAKEGFGERCESFFFLHKFLESPFLDPSSCFLINCAFPSYLSLLLYSLPLASRTRVDSIKDQTSLSSASLPSSSNSSRHFRHMTVLWTISGRMLFEPYTYLQSRAYVYSRAILAFSYCFFFSSGLPFDLNVTAFKEDGDSRYRKERIIRLFGRFFDSC